MTSQDMMAVSLGLNSDDAQLKATAERFIAREYPLEQYRASVSAGGFNQTFWKQAADLGLIGACVPEALGGYALSDNEPALVLEQFGRGLVAEPLVSAVLAPVALLAASGETERFAPLISDLVSGDLLLALAWAEPGRRFDLAPVALRATTNGNGWKLDGSKATVLAAPLANLLLVSASTPQGPAIFLVPQDAAGVELTPCRTIDGQSAADVRLHQVVLTAEALVGQPGEGENLLRAAFEHGAAMSCAEAIGVMDAALALTVDYTRTRKQFGQTIASFQAIQHRLANMSIELEYARSLLTLLSAGLSQATPGERTVLVSGVRAKVLASARQLVSEAVQLHGGIGVTDEASISHYFRKVVALDLAWGDSRYHLEHYRRQRPAESDLVGLLY